ncbi:hypothetical protein EV138_5650 [Kribbella voronezhensis]|uniref:Secreted protein n=1 Tax=Kribbella voronezhensis TaxID=2512212 RepID=A0A4R7SXP4_9ACTN|nr:hypothetical protein [Kribbella voronezhensis]TDU83188.1 hypothetical protein EV138_5650 [Kribbella voronezhensis]
MGTVITIIVIVAVVIVAAAAFYAFQRRRSGQLQERFGPEYDRTLEQSGDRRAAERDLREREHRRSKLDLKPLSAESTAQYRVEWDQLQGGFVDAPGDSVAKADRLVLRMMRESGYPVDDFEQRADDISVDHPEVAQNYRQAHRIAVEQSRGQADTEDLRQAVTAYRRLVSVLLDHGDERHTTGTTDSREQA